MNFPKFLKLIALPRVERIKINSTTTITKVLIHPVEIEMASLFAKMYGFSYELVTPSDGEAGRQLPNGSWTGLAGMLLRNEGDIVVSISMSEERMKFLHFSFPILISPVTFITTRPDYSSDIAAFLKPFATDLWISLFVFLLIMPAIFLTFLKGRCSYGKLLLATFRSLLSQPLDISSRNTKEYFLTYFYILAGIFLINSYKCVLLSFITFPTFTGVRTISELAAAVTAGKYQIVGYPGTSLGTAFSMSQDPNFRIIGRNMLQNEGSSDILDVLRSSKENNRRAFISTVESFIPFKAKYFVSQDNFFPLLIGLSMRKDYCCKELVTRFVVYSSSSGLFREILERYGFKKSLKHVFDNHGGSAERSVRQFSFEDVKGAFCVLCAGYALSIAVFIYETVSQRFSKNFKCSSGYSQTNPKRIQFKN